MKKPQEIVWPRVLFLACAGLAMLSGLIGGLNLLGVLGVSPPMRVPTSLGHDHAALMVFGFIGGAIGLERAVAVRTYWAVLGPIASSLGVFAILTQAPRLLAGGLFSLGFILLGVIYLVVYRRQATLAIVVQATGVIGALTASLSWAMGREFADILPAAVVFVVATIIGERLELARISFAGTRTEIIVVWETALLVLASIIYLYSPAVGFALMGFTLIAIAVSTARVDVARKFIKSQGLPQYSAACMLAGYFWLLFAGILWVLFGHTRAGHLHDAAVHTIFLGFVMSMIFGHAPFIVSGVVRRSFNYHRALYVPLSLLHAGLVVRVSADLREATDWWHLGGVITVGAILVFVLSGLTLTLRKKRHV